MSLKPSAEDSRSSKRQRIDHEPNTSGAVVNASQTQINGSNTAQTHVSTLDATENQDIGSEASAAEIDRVMTSLETSAEPSLPFPKLLGQDLVKIRIGKGEFAQIHHVHKKLLSERSAFFNAAINNGFRETVGNEIVLESKKPQVFEFFLTWLYTGSLPTIRDYICASLDGKLLPEDIFLALFAMADEFLVPSLKSLAYSAIRQTFRKDLVPCSQWIDSMYEWTTENSQLRQYFIAKCVYDLAQSPVMASRWLEELESNKRFAADVLFAGQKVSCSQIPRVHPYDTEEYYELRENVALASALQRLGGRHISILNLAMGSEAPPKIHKTIQVLQTNMDRFLVERFVPEITAVWPHTDPSRAAMRAAGFYYYPEESSLDQVKCLHCEEELDDWGVKDHKRPLRRHREASPDCPFVEAIELGLEPPLLPYFCIT